ncbi:hypothetical protein [Halopiger djelfimassiliensis]|uniref:hypothetical protein n=1 Tax=Halopiger djelfimassiliensis TaxID=1293047 RepID=UPI0018A874AB|nr:hypothetical protein [Halopiger djelfimassiliensis]
MSDDDPDAGADDPDSSSATLCPRCGRPIAMVSVTGPIDAVASPCGCRVPPGVLESE